VGCGGPDRWVERLAAGADGDGILRQGIVSRK
jgi:hypothetical protein